MTTLQNFPEETLYLIFQNLDRKDLQQCQKVCRLFYFTAHTLLLHVIDLESTLEIKQFINSIDHNPDPSYLKAVKKVTLGQSEDDGYVLCKEEIKKLFFRFPNLQEVQFARFINFFDGFDDNICKEFLNCCPKLQVFQEDENRIYFFNSSKNFGLSWKLRPLVTTINLQGVDSSPFGGDAQLISSFPRLTNVLGISNELDTIQKWLPVLCKSPNLTSLKIWGDGGDQPGFTEKYLATLSKHEQDRLLKTLSEIEQLELVYKSGFTSNATEFVTKYLTSVEAINLYVFFESHWPAIQQLTFCNNSLDLIHSAEIFAYLKFENMTVDNMKNCFPAVMDRIFQKPNDEERRVLRIEGSDMLEMDAPLELDVTVAHIREMTVFCNSDSQLNVLDIAKCLFGNEITPRHGADEFVFSIYDRSDYNVEIDTNMYLTILQGVPSAKKVTLDIPENFEEQVMVKDIVLPNVRKLTIRATKKVQSQTLLNTLAHNFPNLSRLNLCYNCGVLDREKGQFQLLLSNYAIKTLMIDITPVKDKMIQKSVKVKWFLVEVESVEHRLYKVSVDLSSVTSMNPLDLQDANDYLSVHVVIKNVERLKLCVDGVYYEESTDTYFHDPDDEEYLKYTTLFDHRSKSVELF